MPDRRQVPRAPPGTSGPTGPTAIYLFNFFTTREHEKDPFEPPFEVLKDIGGPGTVPAARAPGAAPAPWRQNQFFISDRMP